MPLPAGHVGHLDEEPLASNVFETRLDNTQFHGTTWVNQDFGETGGTTSADLSIDALPKVDDTRPNSEPPALVAKAVIGSVKGKCLRVGRLSGVANETPSCVRVETNHEEESKMMGVPESLKALVTNLVMGSAVHENHDEEHEVSGDTTGLGVVDV